MVYHIYNHLSTRVYGLNYYNYSIIILYLEQYTVYILQNSDSYSYMVNVITLDFTTQTFPLHRYYISYICTCSTCSTCTDSAVHVVVTVDTSTYTCSYSKIITCT